MEEIVMSAVEEKIVGMLREHNIEYEAVDHEPVYTNPAMADALGVTEAQTVKSLVLMTKEKHRSGKDKVLIIGGGIANFTDVAKTFTGIIQALREYADRMKEVGVRIYVRRGGPNYKAGLDQMRALGDEIGIPIKVFGPEVHMTSIIPMALKDDGRGVK